MVELNSSNFDEEVKKKRSNIIVVAYNNFNVEKIFNLLSKYEKKIINSNYLLGRINLDDNLDFTNHFGIYASPAWIGFRNGTFLTMMFGLYPDKFFKSFLNYRIINRL